jgi:hypothetical protein
MTSKAMRAYAADDEVKHIALTFDLRDWFNA